MKYSSAVPIFGNKNVRAAVHFFLRFFALGILGSIFFLFCGIWLSFMAKMEPVSAHVVGGTATIARNVLADSVVALSGEWDYFSGVYTDAPTLGQTLSGSPTLIEVPVGNIAGAEGKASFRVRLRMAGPLTGVALHIPNVDASVRVYCNGIFQPPLMGQTATTFDPLLSSLFPLTALDATRDEQEIVITSAIQGTSSAVYKRVVCIGTQSNLDSIIFSWGLNAAFMFGVSILIFASGYVFMYLMPSHTVISLITLFDSLLIVRVVFSSDHIMLYLRSIFPFLHFSDATMLSLQIGILMIGGMFGVKLANNLFDPDRFVPVWVTWPFIAVYGIMAGVFSYNVTLFSAIGIQTIIAVYVVMFGIVLVQVCIYWKRFRNKYVIFQIVKTTYIGVVICVDIMTMQTAVGFLFLAYAYMLFFAAHVFIRLYDSNLSYIETENLNKNLERIVAERTEELAKANDTLQKLSEMYRLQSNQDPLTSLANRRAFFDNGQREVARMQRSSLPLVALMMDLDKFKNINDTWGHEGGDAVLIGLADLLHSHLREEDVIARLGGEEFAVILPATTVEHGLQKAEALRRACEHYTFRPKEDAAITVTISIGVAALLPTPERLNMRAADVLALAMHQADVAVYRAKAEGRNCVRLYDSSMEVAAP